MAKGDKFSITVPCKLAQNESVPVEAGKRTRFWRAEFATVEPKPNTPQVQLSIASVDEAALNGLKLDSEKEYTITITEK